MDTRKSIRRFSSVAAAALLVSLSLSACDDSGPGGDGGYLTSADDVEAQQAALTRRCDGVTCVQGFTCRKVVSNFGVTTHQCVSPTGEPPTCACAEGETCVVEKSGATHCDGPTPAAAFAPADACANFSCAPGTSCRITTINFGVPAPSCMYD